MPKNPATNFLQKVRKQKAPAEPVSSPEPQLPKWEIRAEFESELRGANAVDTVVVYLRSNPAGNDTVKIHKRRTFDYVEPALEYLDELSQHPDNECSEMTRKLLTDQMEDNDEPGNEETT